MIQRLVCVLALALLTPAAAQEANPRMEASYVVEVMAPKSGKIKVTLALSHNTTDEIQVAIPAWAPGAYRIVNYCKQVGNLGATGKGGERLEVSPVDDQTWKIRTNKAATFRVTYDLTLDRGRLDEDHCFLAGPDTYLYVVGSKEIPCSVRFRLPEGWRVGTGLDRKGDLYRARDYDTFIDCPTELGRFDRLEFQADKATYELVIHAKGPLDSSRLVEMCGKIVREQNRMFGGPPFKRYVFLYHFRDGVGGYGLEHLNSTDISLAYPAIRAQPLLAASVTSHEYFHLWNVKRIRPFELGPFDYAQPVRSKALWMCEGVTSYFGDRALARCGIWTEKVYLDHLALAMETLQNNSDRKVTSIEKASQMVWDRKDWPRVDYYNKGELLGLLIDLKIRTRTGGKKGLDDVMRHLYEVYVEKPSREGKGPIGVGYPEEAILKALNHVSGEDWSGFADKHISGLEELPYAEILGPVGLDPIFTVSQMADLGLDLRGVTVVNVPAGSAGEKAGLQPSDRIGAINGVKVTKATLRDELAKLKSGDEALLKILRATGEVEAKVVVGIRERTACKLRRVEQPSYIQKRILDGWLGQPLDD
jgi:predicted metalloprotease with PDZ domain